jgi:hypothetical protein
VALLQNDVLPLKRHLRRIAALVLLLTGTARGHDPFEVTSEALLHADELEVRVTMARSLARKLSPKIPDDISIDADHFETLRPILKATAIGLYEVTSAGAVLPVREADAMLTVENDVEFRLVYSRPAVGELIFDAVFFKKLPPEGYGTTIIAFGETGAMLGNKLLIDEDSKLHVSVPLNTSKLEARPARASFFALYGGWVFLSLLLLLAGAVFFFKKSRL